MSYDWITSSLSGDSLLDSLCMEFPVSEADMQHPPNDQISQIILDSLSDGTNTLSRGSTAWEWNAELASPFLAGDAPTQAVQDGTGAKPEHNIEHVVSELQQKTVELEKREERTEAKVDQVHERVTNFENR